MSVTQLSVHLWTAVMRRGSLHRATNSWLSLVMVVTMGCSSGGDNGPDLSEVRGKVTYRGEPAAGAIVAFYPRQGGDGTNLVPQATTVQDGTFTLITRAGAGAPPGDYRVTVLWYEPVPEGVNAEMYSPKDRLQNRYSDPETSGLTATVNEGLTELPTFELN